MRTSFLIAFALTAASALAQEQGGRPSDPRLPAPQAPPADSAVRPGDDQLSCDALHAEFMSIVQSPAMHSLAQQNAAYAQAQLAQMSQAQQAAQHAPHPSVARSVVQGVATTAVPALGTPAGIAEQAAAKAQQAQLQAQAEKNMQSMNERMQQMQGAMGPMMRAQHLRELAQARQCDWLQQPQPMPGAAGNSQGIPIPQPVQPAPK